MWVFDLSSKHLLFHELVAHGRNTGANLAWAFSNEVGSYMTSLGTFLTGTPGDATIDEGAGSGTASVVGGALQADVAMAPSALTGDPTAALLVLQNAWAVRAVSLGAPGSETQLDVAVTTPTLSNVALGTSMTISSAAVTDGVAAPAASITFPSPGLGTPEIGDVELTLDMTLAGGAGTYSGGVFTLTATNI